MGIEKTLELESNGLNMAASDGRPYLRRRREMLKFAIDGMRPLAHAEVPPKEGVSRGFTLNAEQRLFSFPLARRGFYVLSL